MKKTLLIVLMAVAVCFTAVAGDINAELGITPWLWLARDYYSNARTFESETGNGIEASVEYKFNDSIGVELLTSWNYARMPETYTIAGDTSLNNFSLLANADWHVNLGEGFEAEVGAGIGATYNMYKQGTLNRWFFSLDAYASLSKTLNEHVSIFWKLSGILVQEDYAPVWQQNDWILSPAVIGLRYDF